jgi:hypothetical protein
VADGQSRTQADLKFLADVMSRFAAFRMLPKIIVNELCKHLKLTTFTEHTIGMVLFVVRVEHASQGKDSVHVLDLLAVVSQCEDKATS